MSTKITKEFFYKSNVQVLDAKNNLILEWQRKGDLFFVQPHDVQANVMLSANNSLQAWHYRYGHLNFADLQKLARTGMVRGLQHEFDGMTSDCEVCIKAKQTALPFPKTSESISSQNLQLVHSDVWGPMRVISIGGVSYCVTFTDDRSRYTNIFFLKRKSEVKEAFLHYKARAENMQGLKIKILRTDNGLEYSGKEFTNQLDHMGIKREFTTPYTPQQNGVAERINKTLVEMAHCLLTQAKLSLRFWAEAINNK